MRAKLDNLGAREKVGLVLALILATGVLADRLAVQRVSDHMATMAREVERQEAAVILSRATLKTEQAVQIRYDRWRERVQQQGSDSEAIDRLKGRIYDVAEASGLAIVSMQDRPGNEADRTALPYREWAVDITRFESDMDGLLAFLHGIQSTVEPLSVTRMTVAPGKEGATVSGSIHLVQLVER